MTLLHDISQDSNSCAFTPNSRTYIICRQAYLGNELLADVPFHSKRHYNGRIACGGPSGTVLPLPPTIPLTLLTWEITGHYPKDESRNGTSERRDFLISHVHDHLVEQELKPHVVLFQEEISSEVAISPSVDSIWKGSKRYHKWLQKSECNEGTEPKFEVLTMENLADQASSLVPAGEISEMDAFAEADKGKGFAHYLYIEDGNEREMMRLELPPRAVTCKLRVIQGKNKATFGPALWFHHKQAIIKFPQCRVVPHTCGGGLCTYTPKGTFIMTLTTQLVHTCPTMSSIHLYLR